ncbi:pyridoxal phosphate-dependent aminotransferase EpsN [Catalinimonas alkaloidigena]|uniref:Pyridoxal phosphate-dependent aminotransferase EpsN n=1 Tax=Catalinimonas alkaloidigena TaxID=1075417 RepID=A0A1G9SGK3_9BACT|nr:DegT/DnrJ/EryC1/StrS family aminotransferase [Catalinimonas alkaloidigena]SDM34531.1 pyridoxal phosphate-dependent aminotransferase EpsN [Catalinimonas alkaloidigena]
MPDRIFLSPPHRTGRESHYLQEALDSNWIAPVGPFLRRFEEGIEAYTGAPHAVALQSGTAALHLALRLLDVGPGDEVICPTFNFAGCVFPILYQGATPVFVDSGVSTWNICVKELQRTLEDRAAQGRRPKALIVVHLYGQAAKICELVDVASQWNVPVIEDAAEAFGATYEGQALGTFGDLGVYSFNGNKIITTSGGGALVTSRADWAERARKLATQARDDAPHYLHSELGYNYRLSNVSAALGCAQLEAIDDRIARRRAIFTQYQQALADCPGVAFSPELPGTRGIRWLTCLLLDPAQTSATPEGLRQALAADQIEARPLWYPMHRQPVFAAYPYYTTRHISDDLFRRGLCLPSGSALSEADLTRIVTIVRREIKG